MQYDILVTFQLIAQGPILPDLGRDVTCAHPDSVGCKRPSADPRLHNSLS